MFGRKTRTRRGRRLLAAATCVLWLLGVEVLPNLHLASHDDHHSHAADGTIVHDAPSAPDDRDDDHDALAGEAHHHHHPHRAALADGAALAGEAHDHHPHGAPVDHDGDAPRHGATVDADDDHGSPGPGDQLAIDHRSSGHAAAGIAHHAIALHRPPPPLLEPLAVLRATWRIEVVLADQLSHAPLARPTARGPPATA